MKVDFTYIWPLATTSTRLHSIPQAYRLRVRGNRRPEWRHICRSVINGRILGLLFGLGRRWVVRENASN